MDQAGALLGKYDDRCLVNLAASGAWFVRVRMKVWKRQFWPSGQPWC